MVLKKLTAAAIVALTVVSAVGATAFASERAQAFTSFEVTAAVGNSGFTDQVEKKDPGSAQARVTYGIPKGESVDLTIMEDGNIASEFCTISEVNMGSLYNINYRSTSGGTDRYYKLRVSYLRYYTYNPEQITVEGYWRP